MVSRYGDGDTGLDIRVTCFDRVVRGFGAPARCFGAEVRPQGFEVNRAAADDGTLELAAR